MDEVKKIGTPTVNEAPASQETMEFTLVDGSKANGVRWFNAETKVERFQADISGEIYNLEPTDETNTVFKVL